MKQNVQDAINDQIQAEFHSAYLYLAMSAHMEANNFSGFANWLHIQWQEETLHAMKLYNFVLQRGGRVELKTLEKPEFEAETALELFEAVLKHEQYITSRIHNLYDLALKERDYPLQTLLHWFIDEQVEEEDNANSIIDKLKLIGDSGPNLFLVDQELGQRSLPAEGA
jgi:ferritin